MAIQDSVRNPRVGLLKVDYSVIIIPEDNSAFSIEVNDHFECKVVKDGLELSALFHRSVSLNPPQLFNIEIVYEIDWDIIEGKTQEIKENIEKISIADKNFLCYSAKAEAAMLIAQMTKSNSMLPPLWTPDSLIEQSKGNKI